MITIGIKLDKDEDYLYVATMHEVQESKIVRCLHSGRINYAFIKDVRDYRNR